MNQMDFYKDVFDETIAQIIGILQQSKEYLEEGKYDMVDKGFFLVHMNSARLCVSIGKLKDENEKRG